MAHVEGMHTSAILENTARKLRFAMEDEAMKRVNVDGCLEEMLKMLEDIRASLEDTEIPSLRGAPVRGWLRLVKMKAYAIQDMIDDVQETRAPTAAGTMARMLHYCLQKEDHVTENKMKEMQEQLMELHKEWHNFGFLPTGDSSVFQQVIDVSETTVSEADEQGVVVGRDEEITRIADMLRERDVGEAPFILGIVGRGGIGKTTLAKCIFNCHEFQEEYDSRVWVSVSYEYDLHRIGESIISQLSGEAESTNGNTEYIMKRLRELFNGMKILIVLDDLWEVDSIQLQLLKRMLSVESKESKVTMMVTTRIAEIAMKIGSTDEFFQVHHLYEKSCMHLLRLKTHFDQRTDKEELVEIEGYLLSKCDGLPLQIHALGRILRYRDTGGWRAVYRSHIWHIMSGRDEDSSFDWFPPFLILSYISMPANLRLCFAYFGIFPRDHIIVKNDLIHQWIALGLIHPTDILSSTQVAEGYIRRLLSMSFLQVTDSSYIDYKASGKDDILFTINSVFHELAIELLQKELLVLDGSMQTPERNDYSRYAVLTDRGFSPVQLALLSSIHALRCVHGSKMELTDDFFLHAKCLRVLKLKESSMHKLPDSVCQLRHLGYLNLAGCSGLLILPDSLGDLINISYIDLSGCTGLMNLPESFGDLTNLLHVDLSGCAGLVNLPQSFGNLIKLLHINLSGCVRLMNLPESFGDLINLLHVDLSGCVRLMSLPQSFGGLINLLHVDLSRCYGLTELPESFSNLKKLEHLDLSFWSCFKRIVEILGGLINVKSLNLSHPCCHLADHWPHLMGLKDVWGKLPELRYLNLSMFLNPIFYQIPENENLNKYIECISCLSSLEYLDLSHNIFLVDLPKSLAKLSKLHTLDLSGCARLERVDKWMGEMDSLKLIVVRNCQGLESYQFVVRTNENNSGSNSFHLNAVSCKELEISCLEKVNLHYDPWHMPLVKKQELETLKLCWTLDSQGHVDDHELLEVLQPPHNLQCLELRGYNGETCFPAWWTSSHLFNLVKVIMEDLPRCMSIPPLGFLPNLQELVLRNMASIARIDDASDLSGGNIVPFHQVVLGDMDSLEMFKTTWFIDELVIQKCPKLIFGPLPPRAQRLVISDCDQVMSSWRNQGSRHVVEGPSTPVTELEVQSCNVPLAGWSLLHYLPGLHTLTIHSCNNVAASSPEVFLAPSSLQTLCFSECNSMSSLPQELGCLASLKELQIVSCKQLDCLPDSMQQLTSLQSMHFTDCESIRTLPEWIGGLISLQELVFQKCHAMEQLPKSINGLKKLKGPRILNCPQLKKWFKSVEGSEKFDKIRPNYE